MPKSISMFVNNWPTEIVSFFRKLPQTIKGTLSNIKLSFSNMFKDSDKVGSKMAKDIATGVKKEKNTLMDNLGKTIVDGSVFAVQLGGIAFLAAGRELIKRAITGMQSMKASFSNSINSIISSGKEIFNKSASDAKKWGSNLIDSFVKGIKSKLSTIPEALKSAASTIKDWLGVHSPTKEGPLQTNHLWGGNLMKSIASGMMGDLGLVKHAADSVASAMNIKGDYTLGSPSSGIRVKHPSENSNFIVQGPLVSIEKIEQQLDEDSEKFAKRVARLVKQEIDTEKKRTRLTTSNKLLTT